MDNQHKLYSTNWCGNCPEAKLLVARSGIEYSIVDLDELDEPVSGLRSIPTLETPDGTWYTGVTQIKEYLNEL
tara:strand:+ start:15686 stop:15904 length:219 start_codon:yes stop_codon:yes gene_type:complete